jgi:hypothetical protein
MIREEIIILERTDLIDYNQDKSTINLMCDFNINTQNIHSSSFIIFMDVDKSTIVLKNRNKTNLFNNIV